jgi:hypothetical protein
MAIARASLAWDGIGLLAMVVASMIRSICRLTRNVDDDGMEVVDEAIH